MQEITLNLSECVEYVITAIFYVLNLCKNTYFVQFGVFRLSLFDCFISLLLLGFLLSVIFPHFMPDDDE